MAENLQKSFVLDRFYELRIHPKKDISFKLKLNNGTAEINGAEMIISKQYLFNTNFYDSLAVFSWSGCTITVSGEVDHAYKAKTKTPLKLFEAIQKLKSVQTKIPNLIVAGEPNSGKTSISKTLLNYLTRLKFRPILVDLAVDFNILGPPGSIGIKLIENIILPDEEIDSNSLIFSVGKDFLGNQKFQDYKKIIESIISTLKNLLSKSEKSKNKFFILTKLSSISGAADLSIFEEVYSSISSVSQNFLVIGLGLLSSRLSQKLPNSKIFKIQKSDAIFPLNSSSDKRRKNNFLAKGYLNGWQQKLLPSKKILRFGTFTVYKITENYLQPSVLPKDSEVEENVKSVSTIFLTKNFIGQFLGVCYKNKSDPFFASSITGFVYLEDVDEQKKQITLLCPSGISLKSKKLICTDIKWS